MDQSTSGLTFQKLNHDSFKNPFKLLVLFWGVLLLTGCGQADQSASEPMDNTDDYPAAQGFNTEASDSAAIAVADSVMKAMGGYENWNQTKIIGWNFFGNRTHTWNKQSGRDSITIPGKNLVIDMNIHSKEGEVFKGGDQLTQPDSLQKYLQQGYEMWVNDSYWLLMPFKLKDSGVTLTYMGLDSTQTGEMSDKLKLTFNNVGVTPQNMYYVWVDTTDHLVRQWAHFANANMDEPGFVLPWKDYEKHGEILLSGNRGKHMLSDIKVMDEWPGVESK